MGVLVGVGCGVFVGCAVGVSVGICKVAVADGSTVTVSVGCGEGVGVAVLNGVGLGLGVGVELGVGLGIDVAGTSVGVLVWLAATAPTSGCPGTWLWAHVFTWGAGGDAAPAQKLIDAPGVALFTTTSFQCHRTGLCWPLFTQDVK
jgi:hypothetical protein